jgi:hypothetical protein
MLCDSIVKHAPLKLGYDDDDDNMLLEPEIFSWFTQ